MPNTLSVAVVGAGLMGRWHAYFARRAGARVSAIVDCDASAAARLAARHPHAIACDTLETAFERAPIAAVHICTPTGSHCSLTALALARGKHVLVEKPVTASAAEMEQLIAAARDRRLVLVPVHQFRFQRGFDRMRRDRERLGPPTRVSFLCCTAGGAGRSPAERRTLLLEILPHPLSLFYALVGARVFEALEVTATIGDSQIEIGGTLDDVRLNAAVNLDARPTRLGLTYFGRESTGHVDLFHGSYIHEGGHVSRGSKLARPLVHGTAIAGASAWNLVQRAVRFEWAYPGLLELMRRFYRSIQHGEPPPIDETELLGTARALDRFRRVINADCATHSSDRGCD